MYLSVQYSNIHTAGAVTLRADGGCTIKMRCYFKDQMYHVHSSLDYIDALTIIGKPYVAEGIRSLSRVPVNICGW